MVDVVVVFGFKMYDEFFVFFSYYRKDVFKFIFGIFSEFFDVIYVINERINFRILMFGGGDFDNFE